MTALAPSFITGERLALADGIVDVRRQEALLKTGALQDAIFNSANFSSIATDEKGVIQIFNVGAERMLGYTAAEVVNRITPADISDPEEVIARAESLSLELGTTIAPGFEALVFKASRGIEDIYELTYFRKDGSRFPAIVSVTALRDAQQSIIGYLLIGTDNTARKEAEQALLQATARDISELKRFERTLQEKNVELENASRMKSEFLATMSHELRTPLNAIIGFSEALRDGLIGQLSNTQSEYIGDIFTSGQHLLSLINDILDLSKVEAGMMALELEPVDVHSLLLGSLTIVREKAANQHIALELELGENLGTPQLDMRKTKQIVYNLLSNAVKFTPSRGRVTLRARRVSRSSVGTIPGAWPVHDFPLLANDFNEFLEVTVSDSGIGISRDSMAKLFLAFSQIDSSLSRKFEGTGLGLAMVKRMAELHGGSVAVASAEGEGACFAVWLPMRHSDQAPSSPDAFGADATPKVEPRDRIALVVEDNQLEAELTRLLLEAEGFTVLHAASAEIALQMARANDLSLITLDLMLPGMNGWDVLLRLSEDQHTAHVPVVVVTGVIEDDLGMARDAAAVLQKPMSRAQLKKTLSDLGLDPKSFRTHTVLIVDDDPKAVEVIAAFLPAPAYAVVRAYGGLEAITLAQRLRPDLILLDLMMPGVSGLDVIEALQNDAQTAAIPILIVTAKQITQQDRKVLARTPGMSIHLVEKSGFNSTRFVAEVRRTLRFQ